MKYKFNGLEVDSQRGLPSLGIPTGTSVPVRAGDIIEWSVNKITFKRDGVFDLIGSTLITARGDVPPPVQFQKDVQFAVDLIQKYGTSYRGPKSGGNA